MTGLLRKCGANPSGGDGGHAHILTGLCGLSTAVGHDDALHCLGRRRAGRISVCSDRTSERRAHENRTSLELPPDPGHAAGGIRRRPGEQDRRHARHGHARRRLSRLRRGGRRRPSTRPTPPLEVRPQNTKGSTENVPLLEAGKLDHRARAGRGGARGAERYRPPAGGLAHPGRHVRDARHVRRARRQPRPHHRRPQGQARRLRRQGLGPRAARPLCARRSRPRSEPRLRGDLPRPGRRRPRHGDQRQGGSVVGRRHRLARVHGRRQRARRRALHRAGCRRASSASRPSTRSSRR